MKVQSSPRDQNCHVSNLKKPRMKIILVLYGIYSRIVKTNCDSICSLKDDILNNLSDVLPASASILLKIKDDSWGPDMFIDLQEDTALPDKSVIKVHVIEKVNLGSC